MFKRGREVGNPCVPLLLALSSSHTFSLIINAFIMWYEIYVGISVYTLCSICASLLLRGKNRRYSHFIWVSEYHTRHDNRWLIHNHTIVPLCFIQYCRIRLIIKFISERLTVSFFHFLSFPSTAQVIEIHPQGKYGLAYIINSYIYIYNGCLWPGDARRNDVINRHTDIILKESSGLSQNPYTMCLYSPHIAKYFNRYEW